MKMQIYGNCNSANKKNHIHNLKRTECDFYFYNKSNAPW